MLKKIGTLIGKALKTLGRGLAGWGKALRGELRKAPYRAQCLSWLKAFLLLTAVALVGVVGMFAYFSLSLPALDPLERLNSGYITRVTGKDGKLVHEFYIQRRIWMPEEKLPEDLKRAVIAVEDRSFRQHWGVDLTAYPSALLPAVF
ncbi:MAG TPA: transglycosylase domain-containing protein, partial [Fibrobacteria bacterium]|nr:transglycosylase domain-containing protein [Fibrobacteria bacterium]